MTFKQRDLGLNKIKAELRKANLTMRIGIQGSEATRDHGGIDNIGVAVINEFGAPLNTIFGNAVEGKDIPERSFVRSTFDEKEKRWTKLLAGLIGKSIQAKAPIRPAMEITGEVMVADVKKKIASGSFEPIAALTRKLRRRAGFSGTKPLNVSGQLRNSITKVIENG